MEYSERFSEEDFIKFKEQLIFFAKEEFHACDDFIRRIDKIDNPKKIVKLFESFADDIHEKLGGTDYEEEIDDLKDDVKLLELQIEELEILLESDLVVETLHDEIKLNTFVQYQDKYTPWEFEELMKNSFKS
jgi:hypothetical protein